MLKITRFADYSVLILCCFQNKKLTAKNISNKLSKDGGLQILKISGKSELLIKDYFDNYSSLKVEKLICLIGSEKVELPVDKNLINFSETTISVPSLENSDIKCNFAAIFNKKTEKLNLQKIDYINSSYKYKKFKNMNSLRYDKFFYKKDKKLFLISDKTIIDHNLFIPKGFEVIIKENQKLFLINQAFIISDSPWKIGGPEFKTSISGMKNNLGGGLLIKNTDKLSIIQNTKFSYLDGFNLNLLPEFNILGSINFYETNVKINNTDFENIYSEDAINIFRSNFEINKNNYKNISSDAIDIDFSKGKIKSSKFKNVNK